MATIHLHVTTTATPEQFLAALTDFGPGRSKLFSATSDEFLKVHSQGPTSADVTEGNKSAWERLRYDWSDPHRVVMKTIDSNLWGGASGHVYKITRNAQGTTDIDAEVVREGKNVKGRVIGLVAGIAGKGILGKALTNTTKAVEARNSALSTRWPRTRNASLTGHTHARGSSISGPRPSQVAPSCTRSTKWHHMAPSGATSVS